MPEITLLKSHPQWTLANKIYKTLKAHGYQTYLAGGCVRDLLLGVSAKDIDIATAATPEQVKALFLKTIDVGQNFGVTRVIENGLDIEVAAFRTDGEYKDGRRPETVIFSNPEQDALRRDFTVNALFLDLESLEVIDYVGGLKDLSRKVLQTVGAADQRFQEDHLRVLRALRFSAQLGFDIEPLTLAAVKNKKDFLKTVSGERVRDEILKLLKSERPFVGLEGMISTGIFKVLFSEPPPGALMLWKNIFPLPMDLKAEIFWLAFFWPFFEEKSKSEMAAIENQIKPTRDERKAFKSAQDFIQHRPHWPQKRLGEKIIFIHQDIGPSLLAFAALSDPDMKSEFLVLKKAYERLAPQGALPEPYLKGEDVESLLGPARGEALHAMYLDQLEGGLNSRAEALARLKVYQEGLKK